MLDSIEAIYKPLPRSVYCNCQEIIFKLSIKRMWPYKVARTICESLKMLPTLIVYPLMAPEAILLNEVVFSN